MKLKILLLGLTVSLALSFSASAQIVPKKVNSKIVYQSAKKVVYATDLRSELTNRSLVDKTYADSGKCFHYTALITQASTGAPSVVALDNEVGTVVWARSSTGVYTGTLAGAFVSNKTWFTVPNNSGGAVDFVMVRTSANVVTLSTYTGGTLTDGLLSGTPLEIRVYR